MKTLVIYHKADFDGIFCREIAKKFLPETVTLGWDYGDPIPDVSGYARIYMLDISIEPLMQLPNLIWIDHHKSAIEKYGKDIKGLSYCIDGIAACRLTWQWYTGQISSMPTLKEYRQRIVLEPYAVQLAGEYDIWDKRNPDAELFQHGLRSQELTSEVWAELLKDEDTNTDNIMVKALLNQGQAIQYMQKHQNASIILNAGFTLEFEGLTFIACNHARYNSFLFEAGLNPEHDACLGFNYNGVKKLWVVSLYHATGKEHHDLSTIAVKYGGGGHKGACGFTCKTLPFQLPTPE